MSSLQSQETVGLHVENIGGIDETDVELGPGVNVLAGRNATNRTSLLQAIMAALGSNRVSLKGDAKEGRVELSLGGQTYTRTLTRVDGGISFGGDPYLDDPELADLFALLLESNEARRAVARGDDLREIIMRPVDSEAIKADIDRLEREKRELENQMEQLERRRNRLPKLQERQTALESEIEELEDELEEKRQSLEETDLDVEEGKEEQEELQAKLSELRDLRSTLDEVEFDLDTERESLQSLQTEREELESELESQPDAPADGKAELEAEIEELRDRKRALDSTVSQLQNLIQFNESALEEDGEQVFDLLHELGHDGESDSVTDKLVGDTTVTCWTCGSDVERTSIEDTVDRLRNLRKEKVAERTRTRSKLDDLKSEVERIESAEDHRRSIRQKYERLGDQISSTERRIERLEERRTDVDEQIDSLEETVEDLRDEDFGRVLDLHKEANQLEFKLDRKRDELEDVVEEIEEIERDDDRLGDLRAQKSEINDDLEQLRTSIVRLEEKAVENFNEHVERVLEILEYDNLERIWIERTEREVRDGRRKVQTSHFDLHVVRNTESGAAYEDTIDHLSESEREVTGLVFALAGFLVHDVHEEVPFMLLDSLEAVDSDRIAKLVDYFEQYPSYLVVALLPEDASALDGQYRRVTEI
jgi:DNA repair exonuclease SbcCD ATPase subunit